MAARRRDAAAPEPEEERPRPERCSSCRSEAVTTLPMVLTDGTDVTFVSCTRCERRQWLTLEEDGTWGSIPIESVLERSAKRPR